MTDAAIVVGASSGLGASISSLLKQRGLEVVGVSRRGPDICGDAALSETAKAAIAEAQRRGALRLLVNCAGSGVFKPVGSYTDEDVGSVFNSNLATTIAFCQAVYPLFKQSGGTIVNVMSTAALVGKPGETIYCSAKWAVRGYTEALRVEAKGTPVRIVSVYPGGMKTPFWSGDPRDVSTFMEPNDVASAIVDALFQPKSVQVTELTITRP
jgi:short-subunit dehydrogenase